jgi:hypothetical protein
MDTDFEMEQDEPGYITFRMPTDIVQQLAKALRVYNEFREDAGQQRDSGWDDLADAIDTFIRKGG